MQNKFISNDDILTQIIKNSIQTLGTLFLNSPEKQKISLSNDSNSTKYSIQELNVYFALKEIVQSSFYNLINVHLVPYSDKQKENLDTSIDTLIRISINNIINLKIGKNNNEQINEINKSQINFINARRSLEQQLTLAKTANDQLTINKITNSIENLVSSQNKDVLADLNTKYKFQIIPKDITQLNQVKFKQKQNISSIIKQPTQTTKPIGVVPPISSNSVQKNQNQQQQRR